MAAKKEELMNDTNCHVSVFGFDYGRNGTLGRALCNCLDVDVAACKRVKECSCNSPLLLHGISDDGNDCKVIIKSTGEELFLKDAYVSACTCRHVFRGCHGSLF